MLISVSSLFIYLRKIVYFDDLTGPKGPILTIQIVQAVNLDGKLAKEVNHMKRLRMSHMNRKIVLPIVFHFI